MLSTGDRQIQAMDTTGATREGSGGGALETEGKVGWAKANEDSESQGGEFEL